MASCMHACRMKAMKANLVLILGIISATEGVFQRIYTTDTDKDAVCLDGTSGVYYLERGSGDGEKKWMVHLMGGAWCFVAKTYLGSLDIAHMGCYERSKSTWTGETYMIGSSTNMPETMDAEFNDQASILSNDPMENPHFYNWNRVFVLYCDGFSFSGNRTDPYTVITGLFSRDKLYFRGARILKAVVDNLADNQGMQGDAITDFLLTGCSAGAVATYINADNVREYLAAKGIQDINYKALGDAGFLRDAKFYPTIIPAYRLLMQKGMKLHHAKGSLNRGCLVNNKGDEWKCLIAEHMFEYIQTPVFVLNPHYDIYQLFAIRGLLCIPPDCNLLRNRAAEKFRLDIADDIKQAVASSSPQSSYYLISCVEHCMTVAFGDVFIQQEVNDNGVTYHMQDSIANWFNNDMVVRAQDTGYSGKDENPTCSNVPWEVVEY